MRLVRTKLINVKSYYPEETVSFEKDINIFVGPNAGGKSNLFEAIQGAINNVIFKHVTIPQNSSWRNLNHPDSTKPFSVSYDNPDQVNLHTYLLDRHFLHSQEPATLQLVFQVTREDIALVNSIVSESIKIKETLNTKVANSQSIIAVLDKFSPVEKFDEFIDKELCIDINIQSNPNIANISDFSTFSEEEKVKVQALFELIQNINAFYELSQIIPEIKAYPMVRYFGPQRNLGQTASQQYIDLSSINNYEENFSKNLNLTKENSPSFIDGSFNKICYLYKSKKLDLIKNYKKYLLDYLKIKFSIKRISEFSSKYVYEINFKKTSGLPMRLSSGEKEFFNLISGLILTGIQNGIVLLDEPELHLHSQWQQIILRLITDLSRDFKIQFFIVTHSPKFINQTTLPNVFRVHMRDDFTSCVIKPKNPIGTTELKDLVQFINTTNNEKAFFANKVVLVEGMSDLIVYSEIIKQLKELKKSDKEIEVIEVGSKNNLVRFRRLLDEWKIENYIIADFDYLKEIKKSSENIIIDTGLNTHIASQSVEIEKLVKFSENKLKEILCKKVNTDNTSIVDLILKKPTLKLTTFHKQLDNTLDYILHERATSVTDKFAISKKLNTILDEISSMEKILVVKEGHLEKVFSGLCKKSDNKIKNAIEVSNKIKIDKIPKYMLKYFQAVIK